MGRRGPNPKPLRLKVLSGNPGKRPLKKQPKPAVAKIDCPEWLGKDAKAEWRRVAPELERIGLLTSLDRAVLAGYCESYAKWAECTRFIQAHGEHYITPNGRLRRWPQAETAKQAAQSMRAFASEFGLSPNSRLRLNVEGESTSEDDEFERFLARGK